MDYNYILDAFKKLKGSTYYDKTNAYIRTRIVEFEDENIESKLNNIVKALSNDSEWEEFSCRILNSVRVLTFPKSVIYSPQKKGSDSHIISNIQSHKIRIEKYNNFIDMDLEGFLIGILWITRIGYALDKSMPDSCFGNRLRKNLRMNEEEITASPNLFMPYFEQYESWRNQGLKKAEEVLNDEKRKDNVIITMMDLSRFYYNVDLSDKKIHRYVDKLIRNDEDEKINNLVIGVINRYSEQLGMERNVLPIGFYPSHILANFYLSELDAKFVSLPETEYFGRYVDDIMWVKRVDCRDDVVSQIETEGIGAIATHICDYLTQKEIIYDGNSDVIKLVDEEYLKLQKNKLRYFYLDKNGSRTIIERIKKDIAENTSEFNYIPEEYGDSLSTDLFRVDREDTVNKIRGINSIQLDKYVLSKTVGKNVLMSEFISDEDIEGFITNLNSVLDNKEIISNYLLWEKILEYYVINGRINDATGFVARIIAAFEECDFTYGMGKEEEYATLMSDKVQRVPESLLMYLYACVTRAFSIVWGKEIKDELKNICAFVISYDKKNEYFKINRLCKVRKAYMTTRMCSKNLLPVEVDLILRLYNISDSSEPKNFYLIDDILKVTKIGKKSTPYDRYPYIRTPYDILFSNMILQLIEGKQQLETSYDELIYLFEEYCTNFNTNDVTLLEDCVLLPPPNTDARIGFETKRKKDMLRVAIANVRMRDEDIEKILAGINANRCERAKEITEIVNVAIKEKANVMVLPEAYVPISYLGLLAQKAAKYQMMIICGLEHIVINNTVWNITCMLMPIQFDDKVKYVVPLFMQKKYYSPVELEAFNAKNLNPAQANGRPLLRWNNMDFVTYCCYDLTSIEDRSKFFEKIDVLFAIEWNKDTTYFSNIIESLSRDLYCYCVQANMSDYGDSRITQPTVSYMKDIVKIKGGENASIIVGNVDIKLLHDCRGDSKIRKDSKFSELPAGWK